MAEIITAKIALGRKRVHRSLPGALQREHTALERISFENDLLFSTSPVIRRDARRVRAHDSGPKT